MVNIANKNLKKTKAAQKNKKEIIFSVSDFDSYNSDKKFDVITAMGFSEYLPSDKPFFEKAGELLKKRGLLIVDFRNQLFNLTSANHFTEEIFEKKLGKKLIQELSEIKDLSPQKITESQKRIASVYKDIGKKMSSIKNFQIPKQKFKLISTQIDIRQSSPLTVKHEAEKAGFKLEYVVYFHFHPFPPMYEKFFPVIYNTIALQMQPLGYTPLGAPLCSSFVAVLTKK